MLDLGLDRADERLYLAALKRSHLIDVEVALTDEAERRVESLTNPHSFVLDGAIQIDAKADVTRSLSLTLLDPRGKLSFVPDSPAQGVLYADRHVSVRYGVWIGELGGWVYAPVFRGPLSHFEHQGETIQVEAQGKESLMLAPHYAVEPYTIDRKERLDDAIRRVGRRAGERRFALPKMNTRLRKSRAVREQSEPWKVIKGGESDANGKRIEGLIRRGSEDRRIFYDGRGRMAARRAGGHHVLKVGRDLLTEKPQITYDFLEFRNYVVVTGAKPKGAKRLKRGVAQLPPKHPLSPKSLGRNGVPRRLAEFVDTSLTSDHACQRMAEQILQRKAKFGMEVSASILPVPTLEEGDTIRMSTKAGYWIEVELKQFSIPLTAASAMTIGSNKRIPARRRQTVFANTLGAGETITVTAQVPAIAGPGGGAGTGTVHHHHGGGSS